ncbi:hypothetical protein DN529_31035 [Burkholderia multivorans]|nr:hypothetical protein DN529_31035 [Burkholderia multivorans]
MIWVKVKIKMNNLMEPNQHLITIKTSMMLLKIIKISMKKLKEIKMLRTLNHHLKMLKIKMNNRLNKKWQMKMRQTI